MSKFLDRYATDKSAEEEGQWVDFGDGIQVRVRRLNSAKSKEVRRKLERPYASQYRGREMPDSLQEQLMNQQISQAIVVNWKGVPNPDNLKATDPFPCTPENVLTVITRFSDFRDDIVTAAMTAATFQTEDRKAVEGNSQSALSGTSSPSPTSQSSEQE